MSAAGRPVLDPATGRTVTHVPDTDASGVADAVARAEAAFHGGWADTWGDTEETVSVSGLGQSGYGRELGIHAVEGYTRPRAVWIAHRPGR
ncbi:MULTISPECIES: hypothetical protein [unclassified Streptomyces]|uniref:hypothetical protein n=1 Tax=unclassified Streptomyces TaxID=2593676 RepID=UPI00365FA862